jgi:hypothetical protein
MSDGLPHHDADTIGVHNNYNFPPGQAAMLAQQLKDNPLLMAIFAELDSAAIMTWRRSSNMQQREDQFHQVVALAAVRQKIDARIETLRPGGRLSRGSKQT